MSAPKTVMLIDDDELLRDMYAKKFREKGLEVEAFSSALEGFERLRTSAAPDLLVFDIVMPGIDGFAFLETLKKEGLASESVKVALTNQSADEDKERALSLGASAYLIKANLTPTAVIEAAFAARRN